jgi:hypothetical protein
MTRKLQSLRAQRTNEKPKKTKPKPAPDLEEDDEILPI